MGLPVVLAVIAVWLIALTLGLVVCIRQLRVLTSRVVSHGARRQPSPEYVGTAGVLTERTIQLLPDLAKGTTYLMHLSSDCASCRQVAVQLSEAAENKGLPRVLVLLTGPERQAHAMHTLLADAGLAVLAGEVAEQLADGLAIEAPFTLQVENSQVTGWTKMDDISDFFNLLKARETDAQVDRLAANVGATTGTREDVRESAE